jgi:putative DNA primase/helicase
MTFIPNSIADAALDYAARGWHVFPVAPGEKKSLKAAKYSGGLKWGATDKAGQIKKDFAKWPEANVGIVCGPLSGLFVVEADTLAGHSVDGVGNLYALIEQHGAWPETIEALSPSGSWHVYFKWPEGVTIDNSASRIAAGVDARGDGGMVIAAPSVKPEADRAYRWKNPPSEFELAECPPWLLALCMKPEKPARQSKAAANLSQPATGWAHTALRDECAIVASATNGGRNDTLNRAAFNLGQIVAGGGIDAETVIAALRTAGEAAGLEPDEIEATIESGMKAGADQPRGPASCLPVEPRSFDQMMIDAEALTTDDTDAIETLVAEANTLSEVKRDQVFRAIKAATKIGLTTLRAQSRSEAPDELDHLDLARLTLDKIGRENIICAEAFVWTWQERGVWQAQDDRAIKQAVQGSIDAAFVDVQASTVSGVTEVLKNEIFKPNHVFNRGNPEAVNCPNGELELEAGQWALKPHDRENYRTTQIPVPYDPAANAPRFRQFLGEVFRDDDDRDDKVKSLLELMGYTLMSHARHELFAMLIGPGANGKSVLLAVLEALCGAENVAGVQPSNFERSFQRAHLHMKLANIVTELKQGEVIADAELKAITSGEPATVEHKFKDPFVIRPYATCWFGTNHMPHTRDFSPALFRRAIILQFNRTFAKHEQDPLLKDKLFAELSGILNMALAAYADALTHGFTQPASSERAKGDWMLEADQVAQFVDEACERVPFGSVQSSHLFQVYGMWADRNGIRQKIAMKTFRDRLTRLGFGAHKDRVGRHVTGLVINPDYEPISYL